MDRLSRDRILEIRGHWENLGRMSPEDEAWSNEQLALCDMALQSLSLESVRSEALEEISLLSLLKQEHAGDFHVSITGNGHLVARKADGWTLAEMSVSGDVINGSTDGTALGRSAWNFMLQALSPARVAEEKDVHDNELRK